jgi:hypothetical protein
MKEVSTRDELCIIDSTILIKVLEGMEKLAELEAHKHDIDMTVDMVYCRLDRLLSKKRQAQIATEIFDKLLIKIGE